MLALLLLPTMIFFSTGTRFDRALLRVLPAQVKEAGFDLRVAHARGDAIRARRSITKDPRAGAASWVKWGRSRGTVYVLHGDHLDERSVPVGDRGDTDAIALLIGTLLHDSPQRHETIANSESAPADGGAVSGERKIPGAGSYEAPAPVPIVDRMPGFAVAIRGHGSGFPATSLYGAGGALAAELRVGRFAAALSLGATSLGQYTAPGGSGPIRAWFADATAGTAALGLVALAGLRAEQIDLSGPIVFSRWHLAPIVRAGWRFGLSDTLFVEPSIAALWHLADERFLDGSKVIVATSPLALEFAVAFGVSR